MVKKVSDKMEKTMKKPEKPIKSKEKKEIKQKKSTSKIIFTTGKRKKAVARARFKKGTGNIKINMKPLESAYSEFSTLKIKEPLILAGDAWRGYDVDIRVRGGGFVGQAEACRQAIARGLVEIFGNEMKKTFLSYDRSLLVSDHRRTEPHKPPRSSKGARRYKQRSKR